MGGAYGVRLTPTMWVHKNAIKLRYMLLLFGGKINEDNISVVNFFLNVIILSCFVRLAEFKKILLMQVSFSYACEKFQESYSLQLHGLGLNMLQEM